MNRIRQVSASPAKSNKQAKRIAEYRSEFIHHFPDFFFTQHLTLLIPYRIDPRADV